MKETICHCFGHTRADIERDFRAHGRSRIMERILAAKRSGGCDCAARNPEGR